MSTRSIPWMLKGVLVLFLLFAAITIVNLQIQISENKQTLATLNAGVAEYSEANEQLKASVQAQLTDEDIGEIARSELGYAEPGERIFIDTSSR